MVNVLYLIAVVFAGRYVYQQQKVNDDIIRRRHERIINSSKPSSKCASGSTTPTIQVEMVNVAHDSTSEITDEHEGVLTVPKDLLEKPQETYYGVDTKDQEQDQKQELRVRCIAAYRAKKPHHMSFNKGDVIRHVRMKDKHWHVGVLVDSELLVQDQTAPQDVELCYPVKYVEPVMEKGVAAVTPGETETPPALTPGTRTPGDITPPLERLEDKPLLLKDEKKSRVLKRKNTIMIARASFKGKKDKHMSFEKGDLIEVIKETGKWDLGILKQSKTYPITGKKLYFPHNYVKAYTTST